ncbi:MAG: hypothetical protein Ta2A_25640 [Treponemataceae bacterium]|nr:MAG: hypothetical protein Ta2A_25640 [Treponemataceae bacterium]
MFNIDFTFLWTILNLLILYVFLKKVLFGKLGAFMAERKASIAKSLDDAERSKAEAEQYLEAQKAAAAETAAEREKILEEAHRQAAYNSGIITQMARKEAARIVAAATENAEREKQKMLAEVKAEVSALALMAANKVLGENLDAAKNRKLVDDFLEVVNDVA